MKFKKDEEYYEEGTAPSPQRELAISILDELEDLLEVNNITIPDGERKGDEEEARIFGTTYWNLEDKFVELIESFITKKLI